MSAETKTPISDAAATDTQYCYIVGGQPRIGNAKSVPLDVAQRLELSLAAKTAECERLREDGERYQFLKTRLTVPGAMQAFLRFNNMHPDTKFEPSIDSAIDAARREGG